MSYETGNFRIGSPHSRKYPGLPPSQSPSVGVEDRFRKGSDSLLLILKWDRPMVCLTMLGVTVLIFHRSSFLCSQGSFSTGREVGVGGWRRAGESWLEEERDGIIPQPFLGR